MPYITLSLCHGGSVFLAHLTVTQRVISGTILSLLYSSHSSRCLLTFTFQTSSLKIKPLGKLEPNLVGMLIGWCSTQFLLLFLFFNRKSTKKTWGPQDDKVCVFCFCMWIVYFSTNFDDFLYLPYKIISKQYGNKFCAALAISKIYFIRWSKWDQHPEICRFIGLRENDQNEDLMVVIVW